MDETPAAWFVELSGSPMAAGGNLGSLRKEKAAFRAAARAAGVTFRERYAFDVLWNGLSIEVGRSSVGRLTSLPGVAAVYPVLAMEPSPADLTGAADPQMFTALAMTGADTAQSELGLTGRGVRVAVMDTGLDYDHPDLGGCFGVGCRVEKGYDFVGDAYTGPAAEAQFPRVPDSDPDDCNGHGTHVAGIVGANGTVKGVAPGVTFYAYRVFGCTGNTSSDVMIAAMERALADGADILSMSIGSNMQWPQYPTAAASDRLARQGVVVVAAMGNRSEYGLYGTSAPGAGRDVIGVAAADNTHLRLRTFMVYPTNLGVGYMQATAAPTAPLAGSFPLTRTGDRFAAADACSALPEGSLAGQVALIRRGGCTFNVKSLNAQAAGAIAVVIYNNVDGIQSITVAGPPNPITPGGAIYSTYPLEKGGYATASGTSMATPHVSGAVALLLEARPVTSVSSVRALLQNTAEPFKWSGIPTGPYLDNVHRQGAGMLDIDDAVTSTVKIEPAKLALGESEAGPVTQMLTIQNTGGADVTLAFSKVATLASAPTSATTYPYTFGQFSAGANVSFSADAVTIPAGGSATVNVTIAAPALPTGSLYGGFIAATGGGRTYRVPYAGFTGDYQAIPVLTPTAYEFPWLAKLEGGSYWYQEAGATYTMQGADIPYFLVHFNHQSRKVRMDLVDANSGKACHRALELNYFGRNSGATGYYAISFDGQTIAGNRLHAAPNGTYVMKLSVLKALGDEANPAHWETWTSPAFTIARP